MSLRLLVHDVGHGHSVHAFTPNGQTIVIDLGNSDDMSPLTWLRKDHQRIDCLIITHPHGDHIEEILDVDDLGFYVHQLWRPNWLTEDEVRNANQNKFSEKLDRYFDMSERRYTLPILPEERVGNPSVSSGVSMMQFASSSCGRSNINNHSGVVVFEYLGVKVLISGDNEPASWKELLTQKEFVEAIEGTDVFMASHHGRESGYCAELFDVITPRLCLISDGRVQETDATSKYSSHATGWTVHSKSVGSKKRYCLTTRSDGYIDIRIGKNAVETNPYLSVSVP